MSAPARKRATVTAGVRPLRSYGWRTVLLTGTSGWCIGPETASTTRLAVSACPPQLIRLPPFAGHRALPGRVQASVRASWAPPVARSGGATDPERDWPRRGTGPVGRWWRAGVRMLTRALAEGWRPSRGRRLRSTTCPTSRSSPIDDRENMGATVRRQPTRGALWSAAASAPAVPVAWGAVTAP